MHPALTEIFDRLGSDKGTSGDGHQYAVDYERLVPRSTEMLLEIGIGTHRNFNGSCGSIRGWLEWLEGGTVWGWDIEDAPSDLFDGGRFVFFKGDQGSKFDVERFANLAPEFDVIIDDGSHVAKHQMLCLDTLWGCLKPGGIYVIEDVHLAYGKRPLDVEFLRRTPFFECFIGKEQRGMVFRNKA
jgi:hypothetical protein